MKKLLLIIALTVHSIIMPSSWQKTKDFLASKPMMFVYGATLGGGAIKYMLKDMLKNPDAQLLKSAQAQQIYEAIKQRKNGLVDYLRETAIRTNELLRFCNQGDGSDKTKFVLYIYYSERSHEASKALIKVKNNLEMYNEHLLAIGEPQFYFDYTYNELKELRAINFSSSIVEEKKEKAESQPKEATELEKQSLISHGEKVAKAISARKDGLIGYLKDMVLRTTDVQLDTGKDGYVFCFKRKMQELAYNYKPTPVMSNAGNIAFDTLKKNFDAYNAYLESQGELPYNFCYKYNEYNKLLEIGLDNR